MAADEGGVCPNAGRAMRSSPLRRKAHRFGRRHSQPPIEFPCSAPQRDGKSLNTTGNPANVGPGRLFNRRELLRAAAAGAALAAAGCKTISEPPGPDCDPPSVSGVDWIPDVAHPVAWNEEHLTTADGAPRIMSI